MKPEDRALLVEQLAGAHRQRDPDLRLKAHPAFFDLDEQGRAEAFEAASELRQLEAALDPAGLSTTAQAVLARISGAR